MKILVSLAVKRPVGSERRRQRRQRFKSLRQLRRFMARNTVTVHVENLQAAAFDFTASFIGTLES